MRTAKAAVTMMIVSFLVALSIAGTAQAATGGKARKTAASASSADAPLTLWVSRKYKNWESTLHSELAINGQTVDIFTSDTWQPVDKYLKEGWNTFKVTTTPQEPAEHHNGLIFRVGPVRSGDRGKKTVMAPVLWEFRNDTDWAVDDGNYSHALGPKVKEAVLNMKFYWAGLADETRELDAGDFVLMSNPHFGADWNSPVTGTVFVNGHPFNTFSLATRQVVITPYLKKGKNEIKIVSARIDNAVRQNDLEFAIAGPAEWNASKRRYMVKPILSFTGMQGWSRNAANGRLTNKTKPDSDVIERVIPLMIKDSESGE